MDNRIRKARRAKAMAGTIGVIAMLGATTLSSCGDDSASTASADTFAASETTTAGAGLENSGNVVTGDKAAGTADALAALPGARAGAQIRTARISVNVKPGSLTTTVSQVGTIVGSAGGFVASSNASVAAVTDPDSRAKSGGTAELVVRVPSAQFDDTRTKLIALGELVDESFSGSDVSAQLVDLDARITSLRTQEEAYRKIFEQATTIADILAVQQPLSQVRTEIEQLQAQQGTLKDQVAMSTITVRLAESDTADAVATSASREGRFPRAWHAATNALAAVTAALLVALVVTSPLLLLGLIAAWGWWRSTRRRADRDRADRDRNDRERAERDGTEVAATPGD
jgi:hypothetical protein